MTIRIESFQLRNVPKLRQDLICIPIFSDLRPLRGLGAMFDWLLAGKLSAHMKRGHVLGDLGDIVLYANAMQSCRPLLLSGVGSASNLSETAFSEWLQKSLAALAQLHSERVALELPLGELPHLEAKRLVDLTHRVIVHCGWAFSIDLLVPEAFHAVCVASLEQLLRRKNFQDATVLVENGVPRGSL